MSSIAFSSEFLHSGLVNNKVLRKVRLLLKVFVSLTTAVEGAGVSFGLSQKLRVSIHGMPLRNG